MPMSPSLSAFPSSAAVRERSPSYSSIDDLEDVPADPHDVEQPFRLSTIEDFDEDGFDEEIGGSSETACAGGARQRGTGGADRSPTLISATSHITEVHSFLAVAIAGFLLNINGGYINAAVFLTHTIKTTHMTGATTMASSSLAKGFTNGADLTQAWIGCLQIFSFISGAFVSSVMMGGRNKFDGKNRYVRVLLFESALLMFCFLTYSSWGPDNRIDGNEIRVTAFIVSFVAGLQNAMTTFYSSAVVRTTHVTGTVTDIGVELGAICAGRRDRAPSWKLKLHMIFYSGFFFGGMLGTLMAMSNPSWSLFPPASLTFLLAAACFRWQQEQEASITSV